MNADEIRALADDEIRTKIDETREELMNFRVQQSTGELMDTSRLRVSKRLLARLETILHERELKAALEGES
jgi:large subunit ribosomal protein L29